MSPDCANGGSVGRTGRRIASAVIIATSACSPLRAPAPTRPSAALFLAGDSREPYREHRTPSVALDRIDKRVARLDSTVHGSRSGRRVAIYVFDGGVCDRHQELSGRVP